MREIKFRGKDMSNHWVYGLLAKKKNFNSGKIDFAIVTGHVSMANTIPVNPNTVGQFTGAYDSDGKEIYEDDICKCFDGLIYNTGYVVFHRCGWCIFHDNKPMASLIWFKKIFVIGNTFDNPELLEVEQ